MKKVITFVMLFVMIFSSAALANSDPEVFLYGTWARIVEHDSGDLFIDLFHIYSDHHAYSFTSWVSGSDVDEGPGKLIPWSFENGELRLFYDYGYEVFILQNETTLKEDSSTGFLYHKIYPVRWD